MKRSYISEVKTGERNKIQGFIENIRNKSKMAFLVVKDITGKMQIVVEKEKYSPEILEKIDALTIQSVITVEGEVVANDYVKLNGMEMIPDILEIDSVAEALPIQVDSKADNESDINLKMDYRWVDLRTDENTLIFKIQSYMVKIMRDFLTDKDFLEIHSPKLIGSASESGSSVFEVDYYDRKAYLAQSPQFYKQMAMAAGFDKVFEVGPVFRAEKSYTSRHATEYTSFDLEMSYIDSFHDVMTFEEELLIDMLEKISAKYGEEIKEKFGLEVIIPKTPFPVITVKDLYSELETRYGYIVPEGEKGDLTREAEELSYKLSQDKYNSEFLFVTDFDSEKRAFYHMRENGVPQGYDLLWRGVEITSGAQREHRYDELKKVTEEMGLGEDVKFYLEFFKYGCPAHGGFAIGVDRLTMLLLGLHIKDAMFIFRGPNRLNP
ncbi:MAG: aspartate--tRNA(Asn) ligase [Oscillospiraceae bacterium]|nr:aspartate--tRNA(Asn) ligase [Oscillospiraceae bacterium]